MPALTPVILLPARGFREIKRGSLSAAGDLLTLTGLPALKYLFLVIHIRRIGTISPALRFNNDAGLNYNTRAITDSGAAGILNNQSEMQLVGGITTSLHIQFNSIIHNHREMEKLVRSWGASSGIAGPANQGVILEQSGKWANTTDVITRIDLLNTSTGDLDAATEMIVLGTN